MGFNSVFRSLLEVFPQVDVRVLKAVAIEHSKDADAAVGFILSEVLPTIYPPQEAKDTVADNEIVMDPSIGVERGEESFSLNHPDDTLLHYIACEDVGGINNKNDTSCLSDTLSANIQESRGLSVFDSIPAVVTDVRSHLCSDTNSPEEETLPASNVQHFQSPFYEEKVESFDRGIVAEMGVSTSLSECEEPGWRSSLENGNERLTFDSELVGVDEESFPSTVATRSGQIISTDFLEGFIEDAKNNKKTLSLAMESVISTVGEVELQEEAAVQAKREASEGGLDILTKAVGLNLNLQHAKEANNKLAGEVYGERAILATEARELQSRLLNLSDARDKSLSIIDEMRQDLEARLAVAKAEKEAAEQEKLERKKYALKALAEQELIMENVAEEARKLHQEVEENAKLREFLIDRGRIVDILQGEISVICEDVASLREKIAGRVPLNKSRSSSQINCILASSSTSLKSIPSDQALERTKSSESLESNTSLKSISTTKSFKSSKSANKELLNCGQSEGSKHDLKEKAIGNDLKAFSDNGWEMLHDESELHYS
ncbi:uncharacterized protein LOC143881454 [Tasmannia lanceolata]|uniref:uncharacterized protein LOC143881454 n=1 Tax=Tasmannia lanceolata TaxID=3420 RepID=UPI004062CF34